MNRQPSGWTITTIAEITEYISRGKSPKYAEYSSLPVINQRAIRWFGIQKEHLKYIHPTQFHLWTAERFIRLGDVLWNSTGTGTVGRAYLVTQYDLEPPKVVDSHVTIVRPNQAAIEPRFLFFWIQSPEIQENIASLATGTTNQIELSRAAIASIHIPIAPLNEQKLIANKLGVLLARVDASRESLNRVPLILKRFRQSVLAAATSGQLTQEWRDVQSINNMVRSVSLEDVASEFSYGSSAKSSLSGSVPVLRMGNIQDGKLDWNNLVFTSDTNEIEKYQLLTGDVLFNRTNSPELVGKTAVYKGERPAIYAGYLIRVRCNADLLPDYLNYCLNSPAGRDYCWQVKSDAISQSNINARKLAAFQFELPPVEEQAEIVRRCEALFAYADRLEALYQKALAQVERLTPALLSKAFRGELVPQDPNDEPISLLLERIQVEKARIETERKTKRIVHRSTKESPKNSMKQPSDYSEALRSTFAKMGRKADARQLFDQAGFSKDEVVQFYEALRATPEVSVAFEEHLEESPQQQSSIVNSTAKNPTAKGHFRLVELWLEDFKNLTDYTVRFDPSHSIDIVLGWNGTGKSNLFEALVIIFRDLHEWAQQNRWPDKPMKGYRLRYQMDEQTVDISWHPGEMKRPNLKMVIFQEGTQESENLKIINRRQLPLPQFIFGYYSGPTNRLAEHFLPMKQAHYERLLKATSDDPATLAHLLEQRRFFCAENHHAKYVLLAFCHKEDAGISRFLEDRLRIVGFESALFVIREPRWAKKGQTAENFWGAAGIMRRVMERLRRFAIAPMVVAQTIPDGFRSKRENHYYFFLPNLKSLHAFAAEYEDARTFFLALESTDFSELIYDLKIQVRVKATNMKRVQITFHELSEGEQQLLMVLGLMRFTKSHQSLVLLDEPDTHLNPHWSVEYLKLLTRVMSEDSSESEEQQTSQILMSTHDPLVIASLFKEQIHLLKRDWQTGVCKWDQPTVNPRGLGFTGILTSEMFGMRSDLDEETLADLDNKVRLVAKDGSLTPKEVKDIEAINKRLETAGFQKAFSDPYYAAFIRAWSRRHSELMAGVQFLNPEQQEEIDQIAREVLEEAIAELQAEAVE